jgi:hypothetical protein
MRHYKFFQLSLSVSLGFISLTSYAALPANSVQDGRSIQGGTYGNTADGITIFKNSGEGGLWLKAGNNIRGVEVDSTGHLTNNGGAIELFAPNSVVRLDGNVDVRALREGSGAFLGNGGKVFVDAAYLLQSGNIYANGINGGLVQFNVGAASLTGTARIEAKGFGGEGGVIAIHTGGPIDLQRQTVLDSSGKVIASLDSNIINIEGGLVNAQGRLIANGVESRGGTIRLVSSDYTDLSRSQAALDNGQQGGTVTAAEAQVFSQWLGTLKNNYDGDIRVASATPTAPSASLQANGAHGSNTSDGNDPVDPTTRAGDGGTIILASAKDILNGGTLQANGGFNLDSHGGNGGTVGLIAGGQIVSSSRMEADGGVGGRNQNGGDAGLVGLSYRNDFYHTGVIRAIGGNAGVSGGSASPAGGNGGLVLLNGPENPAGTGVISAVAGLGQDTNHAGLAGVVAVPDPKTSPNTILGRWGHSRSLEVASHAENLFLLDEGNTQLLQWQLWLGSNGIRSTRDPYGLSGNGWNEFVRKTPIFSFENPSAPSEEVWAAIQNAGLTIGTNPYLYRNLVVGTNSPRSSGGDVFLTGGFYSPQPITISNAGKTYQFIPDFTTLGLNTITGVTYGGISAYVEIGGGGLGGGHISLLDAGRDSQAAGAGLYTASFDGGVGGGSVTVSGRRAFFSSGGGINGSIHGGSIILKNDMANYSGGRYDYPALTTNGGLIGGSQQYFQNPQTSTDMYDPLQANGGLLGGTIYAVGNIRVHNYKEGASFQLEGSKGKGYVYFSNMTVAPPPPAQYD